MQEMKIDFITNTIIITKAFREAASIVNSEEYKALSSATKENPQMKVVLKSTRPTGGSNAYKGLTYDYMRRFIRIMDRENIITFDDVIAHYESFGYNSTKVYQGVRNWFLETYPRHKDMVVDTTPKKAVAA